MLALRRFSSVLMPTSECSTSCTFWRTCGSGASCLGSCGCTAGADASMGEDMGPSAWVAPLGGADAVLKSGLKPSLSMGGSVGGAAMVAGCDCVMGGQGKGAGVVAQKNATA
jgi:hypothetical protein